MCNEAESGGWLVMDDLVDGSGIVSKLGERGEEGWALNRKRAEWAAEIRSARRAAPTQSGTRDNAGAGARPIAVDHCTGALGTYMRYKVPTYLNVLNEECKGAEYCDETSQSKFWPLMIQRLGTLLRVSM